MPGETNRAAWEGRVTPQEFELGAWHVTEDWVRQYVDAVADCHGDYLKHGLVPPLALTAYTLSALLEKLELPNGAIHSLQEMETLHPVTIGSRITGVATLERHRERGGLMFTTAGYTLTNNRGVAVQTGKTTVLLSAENPGESSGGGRA